MKNVLVYTLYLCLLVMGILLLLNFIPQQWLDNHDLRSVDILSEIRPDLPVEKPATPIITVKRVSEKPCPDSITCFEDFSGNHAGMNRFFASLEAKDTLGRPVRIAFFGDSFIEGDILCGHFRRFMQDAFGGNGVGFMPVTSNTSGFRQTVRHSYSGWNYNDISTNVKSDNNIGINGSCYFPAKNAFLRYEGIPKDMHLSNFQRVNIYYKNKTPDYNIQFKADTLPEEYVTLDTASILTKKSIVGNFHNVKMQFPVNENFCIYGVSLESTSGILVDNFSMRGQSGIGLLKIQETILQEFNKQMPYDLIILQYGLNVMSPKQTKYDQYEKRMISVVEHLQKSFPQASILLVSVADRSVMQNGSYVTMPNIYHFIESQRRICESTGIVFWNLFEAMGGENSMVEFVKSAPPKGNKDYTHINFKGGEYLGKILFNTLMFEKKRYQIQEQNKLAARQDSLYHESLKTSKRNI